MDDALSAPLKYRTPLPTADELRAYARRRRLEKAEVISLVQGFLPRGRAAKPHYTYLEENRACVMRLNAAEAGGDISFPCTPRELVALAVRADFPLPVEFSAEVVAKTPRSSRLGQLSRPTDEGVRASLGKRCKRVKGRNRDGKLVEFDVIPVPKRNEDSLVNGRDPRVEQMALRIAIKYVAKHGKAPTRKYVNDKLASATGQSISNVDRQWRSGAAWSAEDLRAPLRDFRRALREKAEVDRGS